MLTSGQYWVGDPCYILGNRDGYDWDEVLVATGYFGMYKPGHTESSEDYDPEKCDGYFVLPARPHETEGVKIFCSSTAYGDGCYPDQLGNEYAVDAGLICAFPLDRLVDPPPNRLGASHRFHADFEAFPCDDDGTIRIGSVQIQTGYEEPEEQIDEWAL